MQKIAILGCGYVGQPLSQFWKNQGYFVTATTTTPEKVHALAKIANQPLILHSNNIEGLKSLLQTVDRLIITVAPKGHSEEAFRLAYLQTAQNVLKVLPYATHLQQIIYTSSHGVFGDQQGNWVTEDTPINPTTPSHHITAETEQLFLSAQNNTLDVCILRLAGIYGPGRELLKIFKSWSGTTRSGTGTAYINWVHLEDILSALDLALQQRLKGIYNVSNDNPLPRKEILSQLMKIHNLPPVLWDDDPTIKNPVNVRLSIDKLKQKGWILKHPFTIEY